MFSTPFMKEIIISAIFNLLSANALNLDQSQILLFGKGFREGNLYYLETFVSEISVQDIKEASSPSNI